VIEGTLVSAYAPRLLRSWLWARFESCRQLGHTFEINGWETRCNICGTAKRDAMGFWSKFKQVAETIAPAVLQFTPLAPLSAYIVPAIVEAESIKSAEGGQAKLLHVLAAATTAAQATNAQAGRMLIDPALIQSQGPMIVSNVITAINATKAIAHSGQPAAEGVLGTGPAAAVSGS
jgi:hypothetical protein